MALPSSGPLSIYDIKTELGTFVSDLQHLGIMAGFSAPYRISDFYGYSPPPPYDYYYSNMYTCGSCILTTSYEIVGFPTGTSVSDGYYYSWSGGYYTYSFQIITSTTYPGYSVPILDIDAWGDCYSACPV
jgi:hypothetical protein